MIQLVNLAKRFQGRYLFRGARWHIAPGERVGLCGPNGSGKSTFLRLLTGLCEPDEGSIVKPRGLVIGYLPQDITPVAGRTLFEEVRQAFPQILALEAEARALEARLANGDSTETAALAQRYEQVLAETATLDGHAVEARIAQALLGLGFAHTDFARDCGHFSGGWQMRIALAKLLAARPDLLLLDEPTNHLEIEAQAWLQQFLNDYPHSVVIVSHDRYFLDAVVHRITGILPDGFMDFQGGYSQYLLAREAYVERLHTQNERLRKEAQRLESLAERFGAKNTKASQAHQWRRQAAELRSQIVPLPPGAPVSTFVSRPHPRAEKSQSPPRTSPSSMARYACSEASLSASNGARALRSRVSTALARAP